MMGLGCSFLLLLLFLSPSGALTAPHCENGGTAVGEGCACPPGYSGSLCERDDPATACRNGGTAVGTACYCPPGFGGPLCRHPHPATACRNGATAFGTACVCPPGYRGDVCQHRELPGECLNGGTLVGSTCRCPPEAWGPRCECIVATATATAGTRRVEGGGALDVNRTTTVSVSTALGRDTTGMESHVVATESTTAATTVATESTTVATTLESTTTTTTLMTTLESNTTANSPESATVATESTTVATSLENNTAAAPLGGDTVATDSSTVATTLESTTVAITLESTTVAMESSTVATTLESTNVATESSTVATTLESTTVATKSSTAATTLESTTTATESSTVATTLESTNVATESSTVATTLESTTMATKSSTVATTLESTTMATKSSTVATTLESTTTATESTIVATEFNTTAALPTSWEINPTATPNETTTTMETTATSTLATLCLYLPHGSSPPAVTCRNGGVANVTECLCPPGYTGPTCETPDAAARCAGGSTAVGHRCVCPPGRSGSRCDTPDAATACRNGATAVGTECYCLPGFYGPRCEYSRPTTGPAPATPPPANRPTARTTTARTTVTTLKTTTADPCQNGGRWVGTGCLCPPNLVGARCQFGATTINITAELGPSVTLLAHVTNRNFSEGMGDASSGAFRRFADEFGRTMDGVYRNVSGYRGVRVLSLTRGSVLVRYNVLLRPPPGHHPTPTLHLLEAANAAPQPRNCTHAEGLCFTTSLSSSTRAEVPALNATELCRKYAPANFSRYYYPYRTANGLLCVTNCTLNVPGAIDCHVGFCRVTLEGPRCFCPDVPWYLTSGGRCQTHISTLGLGLGVGLGLGLPLLILLILCIVLIVRLAKGKKNSDGASTTREDNDRPDGRRKPRAAGIYHVNGRGSMPKQGLNYYKPNAEAEVPAVSVLPKGPET